MLNLFQPGWITKINDDVIEMQNTKQRKKILINVTLPANVVADIMRLKIECGKYFMLVSNLDQSI